MSTPDIEVPCLSAPVLPQSAGLTPGPGLSLEAITDLETSYPGVLTPEMRSLLKATCGLSAGDFGTVDFTSRWHPVEPISVLRPSITLAIDDDGRRWIAETSRQRGLPGPVWCVLPDPAVAVYASDDLGGFLNIVQAAACQAQLSAWIQDLDEQAWVVWACRNSLARESYQMCLRDPSLRGWLAELPFGARIYDLRKPSAMRGVALRPGWTRWGIVSVRKTARICGVEISKGKSLDAAYGPYRGSGRDAVARSRTVSTPGVNDSVVAAQNCTLS